ncbi:MAG TPA: sigma 54-interacting transcriptional regulator [Patescibacteria group bacterium]|nr:sigma 54-interacting transcriptional regulator [Patescibacteria group bacterium]
MDRDSRERQLTEENQLLWKIADSSYDGIFMTDAFGKILYCNNAYLRISGLSREQILDRNIADLITAGEIPDACSHEVIRTQKPLTKVIDYFHGVSALVTSMPIFDDNGCLTRVSSNVRDITELVKIKEQLLKTKDLNEEYRLRLRQADQDRDGEFIICSPAMENIIRLAGRIAHVSSPVLLLGESGVGKDMLARYIHDCSTTDENLPFVQINCSAIPESLLESELFGYEPGAFTGASRKGKVGLFELANKGTLFLDEIGEMPLSLQVKLLDVLQTQKMFRLGGTKPVISNPRIIAATNNDLEQLMAAGKFRRDLYYRLNVIPVLIPPLRERKEDLIPLIRHFVERKNKKFRMSRRLTPRAVEILAHYRWPGNVRELRNVIENILIMAETDLVDENCIPVYITQSAVKDLYINTPDYFDSFRLQEIMSTVEKEVISRALAEFGSLRLAARQLDIDLSTLVRKKKKYGL